MSLYCLPIKARTIKELEATCVPYADIIEIWLDQFEELDFQALKKLQKKIKKPFLYVLKPKSEKGAFKGTEKERIALLKKSLDFGASYIDVGIKTRTSIGDLIATARKKHVKTIISYHNFKKTPSAATLANIYARMRKHKPNVIKFAVKINKSTDIGVLFGMIIRAEKDAQPIITLGMGEKGKITRILAPKLGNYLYYAPLTKENSTAEGQLTYAELINYWK